jgi:hypothetical protein
MSGKDPYDSPALVALTELGRDNARPHTPSELDDGLHMLRGRLADDQARRRALRRWSLLGATAAACVVFALYATSVSRRRAVVEPAVALSRIEGGIILEGGYLAQSGRAGVKLFFNEGSKFELTPGTRGRLRAVADDGAHLAVENGTAALAVTQSRQRRWLVEAGPFLVTVKGTAFTVSWDPSSERFELNLRHGRVVVSGPIVGGSIALVAGHRLVVSLPDAQTVITEEPPEETAGVAVGAGPAVPAPAQGARPAASRDVTARLAPSAARSSSPGARPGGPRNWTADLARGQWDRILADVDRDGVDATLANAPSEDLLALADAARYRRRTDLASAALRAQRVRFPHSPRSLDAVFLLGRVEELREHPTARARAIVWYDHYLAQAPTGAYAAEALGRKMILTNEAGGLAEARSLADEYLRRFPAGSYAGAARALQRVP